MNKVNSPWSFAPLGGMVNFKSGSRNTNTADASGEYPFFVCSSEVLKCSDYDFDEEAVIMAGNNADGVFHLHHYMGKFAARQRTYVMSPTNNQLDCRWLYLQLGLLQSAFKSAAIGTTTQYVTIGMLQSAKIPMPPLEVQQGIASALSEVNAFLDNLEQLIRKKRDLKQAAMQQLLSGERRLPGFVDEWKTKTFGDLFNFSGGYSASRDQLSDEGYCYLHYGDIHGSSKTSVSTKRDFLDIPKLNISLKRISETSLLKHGDIVFVDASEDDAGTSKHLIIENEDDVPFISGLHTIVAKNKTNDLAHTYKHYCFQTQAIRQQFMFYAVGTKVSGISKTNIAKLTLPVPSMPEQIAIAAVLTGMDSELSVLEARRDKTRNIKQAMMQELLTGKARLIAKEESHV